MSDDSVSPFSNAIQETLQNAQLVASASSVAVEEHLLLRARIADPLAFGRVMITCEKRRLGGRSYAIVQILNRCLDDGPIRYQHELYRQPYKTDPRDRPHLGAFIAGNILVRRGLKQTVLIDYQYTGTGPACLDFAALDANPRLFTPP